MGEREGPDDVVSGGRPPRRRPPRTARAVLRRRVGAVLAAGLLVAGLGAGGLAVAHAGRGQHQPRVAAAPVASAPARTSSSVPAAATSLTAARGYPAPPGTSGGDGACPSPAGLEPRSASDGLTAQGAAVAFLNQPTVAGQQARSDRALWSQLAPDSGGVGTDQTELSVPDSAQDTLIGPSCGAGVLTSSWVVDVCAIPGETYARCLSTNPAVASVLLVLDRRGRYLVWAITSDPSDLVTTVAGGFAGDETFCGHGGVTGQARYLVAHGQITLVLSLAGLPTQTELGIDWTNSPARGYLVGTVETNQHGQTIAGSVDLFRGGEVRGTSLLLTTHQDGDVVARLSPCTASSTAPAAAGS